MIEVLGLDSGENIASVLGKLDEYAGSYVAVVPTGSPDVLRNPVNVRLLQRRAQDLDLGVAVISNDEFTAWLCRQTGIATFTSIRGMENAVSGHLNLTPDLRKLLRAGRWISSGAALSVVAAFAVVLYLVVPAASVTVTPLPQTLGVEIPVTADMQQSDVDTAGKRVPARFLSAETEGDRDVAATGLRDAPDKSAAGVVTFTNKTEQPVTVPRQTIVSGGPVTFSTTQDAVVGPTIKIAETSLPGVTRVPVTAVNPGPDSNVRPGTINGVSGDLASKLSVANEAATSGGTVTKQPYLTGEDQAKVRDAMRTDLVNQAISRIKEQLGPSQTFLLDQRSQSDGAIEEVTFQQSPEQVQTGTRVHMRVLARGLTFLGDDVNAVVDAAVRDAVSARGQGAQLLPNPLKIEPPVVTSQDGSSIQMKVRASGQVVTRTDASNIADDIKGMEVVAAERRLTADLGLQTAHIDTWPGLASHLPRFAWRIKVDVLQPRAQSQN